MSYEVQKGMLIPAQGAARESTYPWGKMDLDDSFFVPAGEKKPARLCSALKSSASGWAKRNGLERKFVARIVEESGVRGVRIWRTK